MNKTKQNFYILILECATILSLILTFISYFGNKHLQNGLIENVKQIVTNLIEKTTDVQAAKQSILESFNNFSNGSYILEGFVLFLFITLSYALIIALVKLLLKSSKPFDTYVNTFRQTFSSKQTSYTLMYFALGLLLVIIKNLLLYFLLVPMLNNLTITYAATGAVGTFINDVFNSITPLFITSINIFCFTLIIYLAISNFFKIEYNQKLRFSTITKRAFRATIYITLVYILVYLISYLPVTLLEGLFEKNALSISELSIYSALFIHYMAILIILPIEFVGKVKTAPKTITKATRVTKTTAPDINEETLTASDILIAKPSRSRLTGFTKKQEIRGSRIDRPRRCQLSDFTKNQEIIASQNVYPRHSRLTGFTKKQEIRGSRIDRPRRTR